jgi:hypothetical protein
VLADGEDTKLYYDWDSDRPNAAFQHAELETTDKVWRWFTPIVTKQDPKIEAKLELSGKPWND